MAAGTLNVKLARDYHVIPDAVIQQHEYTQGETLKLQRCRVRGVRMLILRPDTHEPPQGTRANFLELIGPFRLREAWGLKDGDRLDVEVEGDEAWWQAPEPHNEETE